MHRAASRELSAQPDRCPADSIGVGPECPESPSIRTKALVQSFSRPAIETRGSTAFQGGHARMCGNPPFSPLPIHRPIKPNFSARAYTPFCTISNFSEFCKFLNGQPPAQTHRATLAPRPLSFLRPRRWHTVRHWHVPLEKRSPLHRHLQACFGFGHVPKACWTKPEDLGT